MLPYALPMQASVLYELQVDATPGQDPLSRDRFMGLLFLAANEGLHHVFQLLLEYGNSRPHLLARPSTAAASSGSAWGVEKTQEALLQEQEQLLLTCLTAKHPHAVRFLDLLVVEAPDLVNVGE